MSRKTAIVICPGRGTYNAPELGYLKRYHAGKRDLLAMIDSVRAKAGQSPITALDAAESFSSAQHGSGENASLLIYACAMGDLLDIDRDLYDIVGVTGNSMGWYLSLAAGGASTLEGAATIVNTMGGIMTAYGQGGQIVASDVNENWQVDSARQDAIAQTLAAAQARSDMFAARSIDLGGMSVLAGDEAGLAYMLSELPKDDRFPFRLRGHAAFHSALLDETISMAHAALAQDLIGQPDIPLIDGVGDIWRPYSTDPERLYNYTFGRQINHTYYFTRAVQVSAKEFAPDVFIVLGPGTTLGAPVAQSLIFDNWEGIDSKAAFKARQTQNPIILSMGIEDQRALVVKPT